MRILHLCIACTYVDGLGYQENILPKMHKDFGLDVKIITSPPNDYGKEFYDKVRDGAAPESKYISVTGIEVEVLEKNDDIPFFSQYGLYKDLYRKISDFKPDIIFVHGGQFLSLNDVYKYVKRNKNVKLYIDQHADFFNSPVDLRHYKNRILHTVLFGHNMRKCAKFISKFWGTTPWRSEFLKKVYILPKNKVDTLVMGGEDEKIHFEKMPQLREEIRNELSIAQDDFVIVTGGKIDRSKNIHLLMKAVSAMENNRFKLIIFGVPNDEIKDEFELYKDNENIKCIGWIPSDKVYDYFLTADLGVFPGTHSVLWEQACACGLPCLFKEWVGMHHVDVGGNCEFLRLDSDEEIKEKILELYNNTDKYQKMKNVAEEKGIKTFSYKEIARRSIDFSEV